MENRVFSEKEMASLFNFGHFKNVHFLKIQKQIYYIVFSGNYIIVGKSSVVKGPSYRNTSFPNIPPISGYPTHFSITMYSTFTPIYCRSAEVFSQKIHNCDGCILHCIEWKGLENMCRWQAIFWFYCKWDYILQINIRSYMLQWASSYIIGICHSLHGL